MYRIAILDDEKLHRNNIRKCVTAIMDGKLQSITEFTCPDDMVCYIKRHGFPFDIIIMDICFEGSRQNGIELAHSIQQFSDKCQIIFCTSFIDFATEVYDVEHVYFVLKSDIRSRLSSALKKAEDSLKKIHSRMLHITVKGQDFIIDQDNIMFLERMQRTTQINLTDDIITCHESVESILERLGKGRFVQCHKSYAVNLSYIKSYRRSVLTLTNNKMIPISRARLPETAEALADYFGELG